MNYSSIPEFDKDLKKLLKKFRTLEKDLDLAKQNAIELYHVRGMDNLSVFLIPGFSFDTVKIFKLKKFSCKVLKGRGVKSGIRVIYAYHEQRQEVVFIEMYYKGEQERENQQRIRDYLKQC
jgi:hypothetical protein